MRMQNLYFITIDDEYTVCFFSDTRRFIKVNKEGKCLVEAIAKGLTYHEIENDITISEDKYESYKEKLYSLANYTLNGKEIFQKKTIEKKIKKY